MQVRRGDDGVEFERDRTAALHFFDLAEQEFHTNLRELYENPDATMFEAADAAMRHNESMTTGLFVIPERTPTDQRGRAGPEAGWCEAVPGDRYAHAGVGNGHHADGGGRAGC